MLHQLGRELRIARVTAGLTQSRVAGRIGTSQSKISRTERGLARDLGVSNLTRHAAVVGLRVHLRFYPGGRHLLDAPQIALLARFRRRISANGTWEQEVPVPIPGDLRAADARVTLPSVTIVIEAITRFADAQAQARAAQLKKRDLGADRLILLLAATAANRRALREAGPDFAAAFPMTTSATLRALAHGEDPGADAIVVL
jgi:transcriptional regulator with XRE-family HTH domain